MPASTVTTSSDVASTSATRPLSGLVAHTYFPVATGEELRHELDSGRASVGLVIDRDFGKDLHRGRPAQAFLIVDASDTTTSSQADGTAATRSRSWSRLRS